MFSPHFFNLLLDILAWALVSQRPRTVKIFQLYNVVKQNSYKVA